MLLSMVKPKMPRTWFMVTALRGQHAVVDIADGTAFHNVGLSWLVTQSLKAQIVGKTLCF